MGVWMAASEADREIVPGTILANKYRVEREIACGGQGVVVLARHLTLPQLVAIKLPHVEGLLTPESKARLVREARAAFRIRSKHVARVLDVDALDDRPFIVMEYLEGADLGAVLKRHGPLPLSLAIGYLLQACEAVAEAHALGVVHRDLKPANLFLVESSDATPLIKVLDFGLAKLLTGELDQVASSSDETASSYSTEPLRIMGSARYMSPEQVRGLQTTDARTDIWSMGTILYELLSATPAFSAPSRPESLVKVLSHDPPPLSSLVPDVPVEVEAAIRRCLQKIPELRFAAVSDLVAALARFAPSWAEPNVVRVLGGAAGLPADPSPPAPSQRGSRWPRWIALAMLVGTAAIAIAVARSSRPSPPSWPASQPGPRASAVAATRAPAVVALPAVSSEPPVRAGPIASPRTPTHAKRDWARTRRTKVSRVRMSVPHSATVPSTAGPADPLDGRK